MTPLERIDRWPVPTVAAAVVGPGGVLDRRGPTDVPFRLASISKLLTAYALLVAVEEEAIGLDDPAGPPALRERGVLVRHLLSHTSGLGFEAGDPIRARPGRRRIYSNAGIETAADHLAGATGIGIETYLAEAVLEPLGMASTSLLGSPAHAVHSTVDDLTAFAGELFAPSLLAPGTLAEAVTVQFPGLTGVVPGVGRFDPCDWGFGFERNFGRTTAVGGSHWAGARVSTSAFGHFGGAGTFLWLDPVAAVACIALTDRPFDAWALEVWPPLCDAVIDTFGQASSDVAANT
jgi:CubicO group peptidase (beta-lactamase class C family)